VSVFRVGSARRGGPRFLSGSVTTTNRLDQHLGEALQNLLIFDLRGQPGVGTCFATSLCACSAQHVSDVRVHDRTTFRDFR
jgi:hypothetical protein